MAEANKAKIRKNILDFDGFGFNEDSKKYKQRMDFLNRLGYDISKRIAFLLGLCPFQTDIPQQDLNELIMYFLMSPCITKQVPITQLPQTFFRQELPKELSSILQNNEEEGVSKSIMIMKSPSPSSKEETSANVGLNMPGPSSGQKAKKSLRPSAATLPPMKKMVLSTTGSPQNTTQRSLIKSPTSNTTPTIQQQFSKSLLTIATSNNTQPSVSPSLANRKILIKSPPVVSSPQEYFIQQQTPDGQQKTFKVIRFAQPPPVTSVFTARSPQSPVRIQAPTTSVNMSISGASLPPGIILLKNKPSLITQPVPNLLQSVPFVINQQANRITGSVAVSNSINVVPPNSEEYVLPDEVNAKSSAINWNEEDVEVLHPLEDNPPTDEELYASIQEIIHSSNFEDITLRNVIDRVSAQYSNHDLTHRHNYMKECVKKIIIGT
ncbi:Protein DEK, partial [Stegodyphus mimosarum]